MKCIKEKCRYRHAEPGETFEYCSLNLGSCEECFIDDAIGVSCEDEAALHAFILQMKKEKLIIQEEQMKE